MEGMLGMLDGFWDSPMVAGLAFHPSAVQPKHLGATSGPVRDGTFEVSGGVQVSYRLHAPPAEAPAQVVVCYFHGNAENCTEICEGAELDVFHRSGAAILSIDYRGYSWGTGQPSLTKLCDDAEECFAASQQVLEAAGLGAAKLVLFGRSIGATCAVHLAAVRANKVYGLVVESGLMSIKQIPMVASLAPQLFGPQGEQLLQMLPEPFDTPGKLPAVGCPTLVMHGARDEIVPVRQGTLCHELIASPQKTLRVWPDAGHNDVSLLHSSDWAAEVTSLILLAAEFTNAFPAGVSVEAHSCSTPTFNGMRGRVVGPQGERVRVDFPAPHGEKALKPANLRRVEDEDVLPAASASSV